MQTDDLIRSLTVDLTPVERNTVGRRITLGIIGGGVITLAMILLGLGLRPDLAAAILGSSFWIKWGYTISLGVGAIAATVHLSRPDARRVRWPWLLLIPFALLAMLSASELIRTPRSEWLALLQGESWRVCPLLVLLLSIPILLGLLWSFRRLAPPSLCLAGAAAGLASGASAATLYCLHCPEASATFVLVWYTLGMGLAVLVGTLLGPRFMRW